MEMSQCGHMVCTFIDTHRLQALTNRWQVTTYSGLQMVVVFCRTHMLDCDVGIGGWSFVRLSVIHSLTHSFTHLLIYSFIRDDL